MRTGSECNEGIKTKKNTLTKIQNDLKGKTKEGFWKRLSLKGLRNCENRKLSQIQALKGSGSYFLCLVKARDMNKGCFNPNLDSLVDSVSDPS